MKKLKKNAWNNKGLALDDLGKFDEAIKCYDKALEIYPEDDITWNNKGFALNSLGKFDEAIKCYNRALEINPTSPEAQCNKEDALSNLRIQETRQLDKAKEKIQKWKDEGYNVDELEKMIEGAN